MERAKEGATTAGRRARATAFLLTTPTERGTVLQAAVRPRMSRGGRRRTRDVIPLAANDIHLVMQNDISDTSRVPWNVDTV